jgi:hypothetical protein
MRERAMNALLSVTQSLIIKVREILEEQKVT